MRQRPLGTSDGPGNGITIALPEALRPFAGGDAEIRIPGRCGTVGEALEYLADRYPGVVDRVVDERGAVRRHVNLFVDSENIRFADGLGTALGERSTVVIVPSVSGG